MISEWLGHYRIYSEDGKAKWHRAGPAAWSEEQEEILLFLLDHEIRRIKARLAVLEGWRENYLRNTRNT